MRIHFNMIEDDPHAYSDELGCQYGANQCDENGIAIPCQRQCGVCVEDSKANAQAIAQAIAKARSKIVDAPMPVVAESVEVPMLSEDDWIGRTCYETVMDSPIPGLDLAPAPTPKADDVDWQAKYLILMAERDQWEAKAEHYKALFERSMLVIDKMKERQRVFV